jgi:hypothetical protein
LLALRRCVDLAAGGRTEGSKLPYRDSVLTHLLSDVIKGASEATFVACASPFFKHLSESLSTLQFAARVQTIPVVTKVNEDEEVNSIRRFDAEIKGLDVELLNANKSMEAVRKELEMRQIRLNDLQEVKEEQESMILIEESSLATESTVLEVGKRRRDRSVGDLQRGLDALLDRERVLNRQIFELQGTQRVDVIQYEKARVRLVDLAKELEAQERAQERDAAAAKRSLAVAAAEEDAATAAVARRRAEADALEADCARLHAEIARMEQDILLHQPSGKCCSVS